MASPPEAGGRGCRQRVGDWVRQLVREMDEIKRTQRVSDRLHRKEPYPYGDRPKSKVIEADFEQNLERRKTLFREYFWRTGRYADQKVMFWERVGAIPPKRLPLLRQKTINAIGAFFKSGNYPVYWQSDEVLKIKKMRMPAPSPPPRPSPRPPRRGVDSGSIDGRYDDVPSRFPPGYNLPRRGPGRGTKPGISQELVPTVEVATEFSPLWMQKHADELHQRAKKSLPKALEREQKRLGRKLTEEEKRKIEKHHNRFSHRVLSDKEKKEFKQRWDRYIALPKEWLQKYTSVHKEVNDMVDEISSRSFQAARIRYHMKRKDFYLDDLPHGINRDDHAIAITWYEGGERKVVKKVFQNKRSALSFLEDFEGSIKELRGGFLSRGKLADRIIEQALLRERLGILKREISFFLNNQEGSTFFKKTYAKEELGELTRFYHSLVAALDRSVETVTAHSKPVVMSDPSLGYDLSDRALKQVRMRQIRAELKYVMGYDILNFLGNVSGAPLSWAGRKTGWRALENMGDGLANTKPAQLKGFRKRLNQFVEADALKRRVEGAMTPYKKLYRFGLKALAPGGAVGVLAGEPISDFAVESASSIFHKYWGSKWACINAEIRDLEGYKHLIEGRYLEDAAREILGSSYRPQKYRPRNTTGRRWPRTQTKPKTPQQPKPKTQEKLEEIIVEALGREKKVPPTIIHQMAERALIEDEIFKLCLANHYLTRWEEQIALDDYLGSFNPFSERPQWDKIDDDLYEEFRVLFIKRFLYLKETIIDDVKKRAVATYVSEMFHLLMKDEDALNECAFMEKEAPYKECLFENLEEELKELSKSGVDIENMDDLARLYSQGKVPHYHARRIERKIRMIEEKKALVDSVLGTDRKRRWGGRYRPWPPSYGTEPRYPRPRPPSRPLSSN